MNLFPYLTVSVQNTQSAIHNNNRNKNLALVVKARDIMKYIQGMMTLISACCHGDDCDGASGKVYLMSSMFEIQ